MADELPKVSWKSVPSSSLSSGMTSGSPYMMRSRLISPAIEMSKVFIEEFAAVSVMRFENIPCRGRDGIVRVCGYGGCKEEIWMDERIEALSPDFKL
jgi:hypothetical protein